MRTILSGAIVALCFSISAQGIKFPAPSPVQTIKQDLGLSQVEIVYSRPSTKGRKIFGDLVPYGKLWRTGANRATKIVFGEDVKVGGQSVKAGEYALYTKPGEKEWEILVNKGANNAGLGGYKTEDDVAKFSVPVQTTHDSVESFTIQLGDLGINKATIQLSWEKTLINIPIEIDLDAKLSKQISTVMESDTKPYFESANYYYETGKDLKKSLEWVDKALVNNPKAFWIYHLKAKIQARSGDKVGATATAQKSIELAKESKNDDYVALNEKLLATLK